MCINGALDTGITVVVPTFNRGALLAHTLESLCSQNLNKNLYEVIVVDDGSNDGTEQVVEKFSDRINIRYYFQDNRGFRVAAARNIGIYHAHFEVTLFIDAGILVSSRLLKLHYLEHLRLASLAVLGLSYGVMEHERPGSEMIVNSVGHDVDSALTMLATVPEVDDCRARYLKTIDFNLCRMALPWLIFWTGHVSVSTKLLRCVSGFDEWFRRWGGEDVELGLRLFQAGCRFRLLPSVESIHYPHPKDAARARRDSKINAAYIHRKHGLPETEPLARQGWESIELAEGKRRGQSRIAGRINYKQELAAPSD